MRKKGVHIALQQLVFIIVKNLLICRLFRNFGRHDAEKTASGAFFPSFECKNAQKRKKKEKLWEDR